MGRIDKLTLVLENCDVIEIPGKYIGGFRCADLRNSVERVAMNAIADMATCHDFFCEIHKDANAADVYHSFGGTLPFERLTQDGYITNIEFSIVDDAVWYGVKEKNQFNSKDYAFRLYWPGDGENNVRQKSFISKDGWLYIGVNDESYEEFSGKLNGINSWEYGETVAKFYDIGDERYEIGRNLFQGAMELWEGDRDKP